MKIYFCGSITGNREHAGFYYKFIEHLKSYGEVLTEETIKGSDLLEGRPDVERMQHIHDRDMKWLKESDVVIADITIHSIGVGYEIGIASGLGKKVLCLYKEDVGYGLSPMIAGNSKITVSKYTDLTDATNAIDTFLGKKKRGKL
jgi:nucleoside 2-deoxyribosyltransferase